MFPFIQKIKILHENQTQHRRCMYIYMPISLRGKGVLAKTIYTEYQAKQQSLGNVKSGQSAWQCKCKTSLNLAYKTPVTLLDPSILAATLPSLSGLSPWTDECGKKTLVPCLSQLLGIFCPQLTTIEGAPCSSEVSYDFSLHELVPENIYEMAIALSLGTQLESTRSGWLPFLF